MTAIKFKIIILQSMMFPSLKIHLQKIFCRISRLKI